MLHYLQQSYHTVACDFDKIFKAILNFIKAIEISPKQILMVEIIFYQTGHFIS